MQPAVLLLALVFVVGVFVTAWQQAVEADEEEATYDPRLWEDAEEKLRQ